MYDGTVYDYRYTDLWISLDGFADSICYIKKSLERFGMKKSIEERIKRIEEEIQELEEELEIAEYGSYEYDVAAGDYEYLTLVLKKLKNESRFYR